MTQHKPSRRNPYQDVGGRTDRRPLRFRRVHILLKRDGLSIGRNLVYRFYRETDLPNIFSPGTAGI